ncbi:MAG: GNAT family N-acetyltransferase [Bacteroidales bacterium]|nr:GNAT family N-acetyltransferase [Bacteroidales bacterium]
MNSVTFRTHIIDSDPDTIEFIIRSSGFFYEDEIPVARELAEETIKHGYASGYKFVFAEINGETLGYAAYGFIDGTDGSYDLYWIAVDDKLRGKGIGKAILEKVMTVVKLENGRQLIAETSSLSKYLPTREFYLHQGFTMVATVPDFFRVGDDKVFFVRKV